MKKEKILALLTISSMCLASIAGCSSEEDSATPDATSGTTTIATQAEESEDSTPETTVEETEAPLPYVELESYYLYDNNDNYASNVTTNSYTNICMLGATYSWTENSDLDEINHEVYFNGDFLTNNSGGMYGWAISSAYGFELNEQGYLPSGTYTVITYNRNEVVLQFDIEITFDEATAPERDIITRGYQDGYVPQRFFSIGDFALENTTYSYEAGCPGIYVNVMYSGCNSNGGNYVAQWTYNGEAMPDVEYTYDANTEGYDREAGKFAFEMPDGSPMPAGSYEMTYYYEGELFATTEFTLR